VLVKIPGEEHGAITSAVQDVLGKSKVTHDDVAGLNAALEAYKEDLVPGLRDNFADDRAKDIGHLAPEGHVWVDRNVLGDLGKPGVGPRGKVARTADTINSAVTAATVYFKIGHVATRVLTNAATTFLQGSAAPGELARSVGLWRQLSQEDRLRALAAAGQHGFESMPHEGANVAGRVATRGAQWWAKHADAPFRFASIAYEARRAGYSTPAQFSRLLRQLENPAGLPPEEAARVEYIAKEANRAGIAYDRLNQFERRFLTRGVWFYPWIKGTINFAGHTATEHPYKTAVLANLGVQARERQQQELGDLPSYEGGLFQLGKADARGRPLVADFSTFSPFATPADVADTVARPGQISGFLNPALGAGVNLITGRDQYGQPTTSPVEGALSLLAAATPEQQILTSFLQRHQDQSKRMFPKSHALAGTASPLLRALVGPAMPRRVNTDAAHKAAAREKSGR
jgi:hypothetical protein